jgi:hypothetical protein
MDGRFLQLHYACPATSRSTCQPNREGHIAVVIVAARDGADNFRPALVQIWNRSGGLPGEDAPTRVLRLKVQRRMLRVDVLKGG